MRNFFRSSPAWALLTGVLLVVGAFAGIVVASQGVGWRSPIFGDVRPLPEIAPVRVLPHPELALVSLEARGALEAQRPWEAWRLMRDAVDAESSPAGQLLLAARAAAGWGGWAQVVDLLAGQSWLDVAFDGEGLLLLGRAQEELGRDSAAAAAYRRYLADPAARRRGEAFARLGAVLRAAGEDAAAASAFAAAAPLVPDAADWLGALAVQELATARAPAAAPAALRLTGGSAPVRLRRVEAEVAGWAARGDTARALRRLSWEARVLRAQGAAPEAARLQLRAAALLREQGRGAEARALLSAVASADALLPALRLEAAQRLGELDGLNAGDQLARAAALEAAGQPGHAARALRAALDLGAAGGAERQLRLARLFFAGGDYAPARSAAQRAADASDDGERAAEARLYAARSLYRLGSRSRSAALLELRRVASEYPGTAAAGTALFLLGDEASSLRDGLAYYRRAAEAETRRTRARRSSAWATAACGWTTWRGRCAPGTSTWSATRGAARRRGWPTRPVSSTSGAATTRGAGDVPRRDARRPGLLLRPARLQPAGRGPAGRGARAAPPWVGLASDPGAAAQALQRLDALEALGLDEAWEEELDAARRGFAQRPLALLVLAEGLRDRGHPVEAIRLGRSLLRQRGGQWDERLLRVVFPLPYRGLVEAEAERADVDPMLLAGLVRQESSFRADARSWVGARGLTQIMPATGRWLARYAGVRSFYEPLLDVPEINLRMGAVYIGSLLDHYDGAADLALAGYNAGPGRADRWRRELHHGRDTDAFREAIPFDETREYVKVVLRNASIYRRLYGSPREPGLVRREDG